MEPRISLVTLGVADLERAVAFYEQVIGWRVAARPPGVAFFDLGGVVLSLYPHADLAKDLGVAPEARGAHAYPGFSLAHNLRSETEVDALFARLGAAGADIVKPPERAFWGGYSGFFRDPDGHVWEIAHNPAWTIRADGRIDINPA